MNTLTLQNSKNRLTQQIASLNAQSAAVSAELEALVAARDDLNSQKTKVKYELISHGNIKENYTLAGMAYLRQTEEEEEALKSVSSHFKTSKTDVIEKLDKKIDDLKVRSAGLTSSLIAANNSLDKLNKIKP